jgi:hypothetical protein
MHAKSLWIDSPRQAVSNGRWHATWFLTVEGICPLQDDHVKFAPKWLRSYESAPKSNKEGNDYKQEVISSALKTSKGGTWKDINTHQEPHIFVEII